MAKIRSHVSHRHLRGAELAICGVSLASPAQAAATQCTGTLAQYGATIKQLETFSAKAQVLADQNPLYISDVEYYASALAQARTLRQESGRGGHRFALNEIPSLSCVA